MSRDAFSDSERRYFARRARTGDEEGDAEVGTGGGLDREVVGLVAVAAVGLGVAAGVPAATAAVLSALLLVAALERVRSPTPRVLAVVSLATVIGLCGVVASSALTLPGRPIVPLAAVAVGATATALRGETGALAAVVRLLRDSLVCGLLVGVPIVAVATVAVPILAGAPVEGPRPWLVLGTGADVLTATPFRALLTLVVLAGVAWLSVDLVRPSLESTPLSVPEDVPSTGDLFDRVLALPSELYYLFALVGLLLAVTDLAGAFEAALTTLGPVGTAVEAVLVSGALHAVAGGVVGCCVAVFVGSALEVPARYWLGAYPLRTLAMGTGGGVVAAALAVSSALPSSPVPAGLALLGLYGVLAGALLAVVLIHGLLEAIGTPTGRLRRRVLTVGAGATALSSGVAALEGAEPLFVFAGVAAAVLVWDLGENALTASDRLGEGVDTREPELVHATGSLVVGALGVAVAAIATYVLGHVPPPPARWQAVAPLALAVLAATIFLLVVGDTPWKRERESASRSQTPSSKFAERHLFVAIVVLCALYGLAMIRAGQTLGAYVAFAIAAPFALLTAFDWLAAFLDPRRER